MSQTTVLIVDDHAVVRKALRCAVESHSDLSVVGEAATVSEAIDVAGRTHPQVITLDLSMPDSCGVASIRRMRAAVPGARIVVVTIHDDRAYERGALAVGAAGYVCKRDADATLAPAIRAADRQRALMCECAVPSNAAR